MSDHDRRPCDHDDLPELDAAVFHLQRARDDVGFNHLVGGVDDDIRRAIEHIDRIRASRVQHGAPVILNADLTPNSGIVTAAEHYYLAFPADGARVHGPG